MAFFSQKIKSVFWDDVKFYNVVTVSFVFMVFFSGFLPAKYVTPLAVNSIKLEDTSFFADGYTSLAILYGVFAFANWIAPSVINVTGPKYGIFIGFIIFGLYIASFLKPDTWMLYVASAITGIGAAILWTALGMFLTINSDESSRSRNSGIFWTMFEFSLLFGHTIIFFKFESKTVIDGATIFIIFVEFLVVSLVGTALVFTLRHKVDNDGSENENENQDFKSGKVKQGPWSAFVRSLQLFVTKDMFILNLTFIYTGLELGFFSGIYGTALGFTQQFGIHAKQCVGLSGIFIGLGEITGAGLSGLYGKWSEKLGRDPMYVIGYLSHIIAFYLIFLNLPAESPLHETMEAAFISSSEILAMICSFLLGFGDGCFNPLILSLLGSLYSKDSAPAFALYKFVQSLATSIVFIYSQHVLLYHQLLILTLTATVSLGSFCWIEWSFYVRQIKAKADKQIPEDDVTTLKILHFAKL